jgi:hypothetical protein
MARLKRRSWWRLLVEDLRAAIAWVVRKAEEGGRRGMMADGGRRGG